MKTIEKLLKIVELLKRNKILFVPIPVLDTSDQKQLECELHLRLEAIVHAVEKHNEINNTTINISNRLDYGNS